VQPGRLERDVEARLRAAELTYDQVGATSGALPAGYHHLVRRVVIGTGDARFDAASDALLGWQMHLRSGLQVSASSELVVPGAVAMLGLRAGPLRLGAPCRVVYVLDEPRRKGFAYGTLPGHPESGEEAFVIDLADDDTVSFSVIAYSRPASALARLAGPIGRLAQGRMTDRYVRSLAAVAGVR
jgi:uncharacterized protein (UPF0548 family)